MTFDRKRELHAALRSFLEHMLRIEASHLYLTAGSPPVFRVDEVTYPGRVALAAEELTAMTNSLLDAEERVVFGSALEIEVGFSLAPEQRFRIHAYVQRGSPGLVVRALPGQLKTLEELAAPEVLGRFALERKGLVVVAGERHSGKDATIAAMVDHRNASATGHILTVEDPIERIHAHKQCVVSQREVGIDTPSYAEALRGAATQAPDLIQIGEIRDPDTLVAVLALADSGHLCLATLQASAASDALERLLCLIPESRGVELRFRLARCLRAVVAQRAVPARAGRLPIFEVLHATSHVREILQRGEFAELAGIVERAGEGSSDFGNALVALVREGRLELAEALAGAVDSDELQKLERVFEGGAGRGADELDADTPLRLVPEPVSEPAPPPAPPPAPERRGRPPR